MARTTQLGAVVPRVQHVGARRSALVGATGFDPRWNEEHPSSSNPMPPVAPRTPRQGTPTTPTNGDSEAADFAVAIIQPVFFLLEPPIPILVISPRKALPRSNSIHSLSVSPLYAPCSPLSSHVIFSQLVLFPPFLSPAAPLRHPLALVPTSLISFSFPSQKIRPVLPCSVGQHR